MNRYFDTRFVIPCILILSAFTLQSCSKKGSDPTPQSGDKTLSITSIDVQEGPYNTAVTITGTNFSSATGDDQVFFNGVAASVTAATSSQLKVLVPLDAGTGHVSVKVNSNSAVGPVFTYQLSEIVSTFAGNGSGAYLDGTGLAASFLEPDGLTIDANGNLFIADNGDNAIRKITPAAVVTTLAGNPKTVGSADGTGITATFNSPNDLVMDLAGNIYEIDFANHGVRKITSTGVVTTIGGPGNDAAHTANLLGPIGIAIDKTGNLYITGIDNLIKKISPNGLVTVFAGSGASGSANGNGTNATFNGPTGMAFDAEGNLYVSDNGTMIRKITPSGDVTIFAGSTTLGSSDGTGASASFARPMGLAFDKDGDLYVADSENNLIRKITPSRVVSTFAGSGSGYFRNGIASEAEFASPEDVCIDSNGNVYVSDSHNSLIRKISLQ